MNLNTEFDIIVFGANGYTGRLVAEHLSQRYGIGGEVVWAMAGRSAAELAQARDEIGAPSNTPLVIADATDPVSLRKMVGRTKAVITTVGPYQLYGSDLVAACAQAGTDYLDLSGEPHWMRSMIDKHEAQAKTSGARILFACGFDSIPSEVGVWFCQDTSRRVLGAPVAYVKGRIRGFKGGISGGSMASGKATREALEKDPALAAVINSPFGLTPGFQGPPQPSGTEPKNDPDVGDVVPFMLAAINAQNVHRSNLLMGHAYGRDFIYDEMMLADATKSAAPPDVNTPSGGVLKPGEGPAQDARQSGFFDMLFIGTASDGRKVQISLKGTEDPGYGSTPRMIAESAICLVRSPDVPGGVWTPGAALQGRLVDRLQQHAGLTFAVED
ncbi:saccharopine dehydrogenase [Brenneria alni]|uniref:Saccharopine dehydrogenase n=1 Tax=Brenneria alni TaxID=71656 RepID=A0A421DU26_9GAMM|nr:saccharopine dehydrogenase NADP-binding domain-containing protein [Brenneria alni]RLM28256.1 saccharopine dehydrogenase [Brenneria alni]